MMANDFFDAMVELIPIEDEDSTAAKADEFHIRAKPKYLEQFIMMHAWMRFF